MTVWMNLPSERPIRGSERYPLFNRVSLETSSRCNRRCVFCPISTGRRDFDASYMTDETFSSVIDQLSELGFDGVLQLFLLNEPFIDPNLQRRVEEIAEKLPDVFVYVSTNGDAFGKQFGRALVKIEEAFSWGIHGINLNVYDEGTEQDEYFHSLADELVSSDVAREDTHKYRKKSLRQRWISVTNMQIDGGGASGTDMFYDRTSEDRTIVEPVHKYCARPHRHIVILWDGEVPLCCALDPTTTAHENLTVGYVTERTIEDIWNDELFLKYRWYLQGKSRSLPGCDTCNHQMSYSHVTRMVKPTDEQIRVWQAEVPRMTS